MNDVPLWRAMLRQGIDWAQADGTTVAALRLMLGEAADRGPGALHALVAAVEAVDAGALPMAADSLHGLIDEAAAAECAAVDALDAMGRAEAEAGAEGVGLREHLAARLGEGDEGEPPPAAEPRPRLHAPAGVRMRGPDAIHSGAELAAIRGRTHSVAADAWEPIAGGAILPPARPTRPVSVGTPRARAGLGARRSAGGSRRTRSAGSGGGGGSGDPDLGDEPEPPAAEPPAPGDVHHRGTHDVTRLRRRGDLLPAAVYVLRIIDRLAGGER